MTGHAKLSSKGVNSMPTSINIPTNVREEIGAFMDYAQDNNHTLSMAEALKAIRRKFPYLETSDAALVGAFTSEAASSNVLLHFDILLTEGHLAPDPTPNQKPSLDRWENEGGAAADDRTKWSAGFPTTEQ